MRRRRRRRWERHGTGRHGASSESQPESVPERPPERVVPGTGRVRRRRVHHGRHHAPDPRRDMERDVLDRRHDTGRGWKGEHPQRGVVCECHVLRGRRCGMDHGHLRVPDPRRAVERHHLVHRPLDRSPGWWVPDRRVVQHRCRLLRRRVGQRRGNAGAGVGRHIVDEGHHPERAGICQRPERDHLRRLQLLRGGRERRGFVDGHRRDAVERWDGSTWTIVPTSAPTGMGDDLDPRRLHGARLLRRHRLPLRTRGRRGAADTGRVLERIGLVGRPESEPRCDPQQSPGRRLLVRPLLHRGGLVLPPDR